jgi:hypothetical protein
MPSHYGKQKQEQKQTVIVKIGDTEKKKRRKRRKKPKRVPPPPAQVVQTFRPERYSFVPRTFPANPPDPLRQQVASRESISNPLSQRSSYSTLRPPTFQSVVATQEQIEQRIRASAERSARRVQEKEEELKRQSIGGFGGSRPGRTPIVATPLKLDARMAEDQLPTVHTEPRRTRYEYPVEGQRMDAPFTPLDIRNERRVLGSGKERTSKGDVAQADDLNTLLGAV